GHVQGVAFHGEPSVAELLAACELFGIYSPRPTGDGNPAALDRAIRVLSVGAARSGYEHQGDDGERETMNAIHDSSSRWKAAHGLLDHRIGLKQQRWRNHRASPDRSASRSGSRSHLQPA